MLSIRKVRLLITSRYIAMQSYECVIISTMFLIYFISYGCNGGALVFLGGAEASASPSFALPMFITIKKIIILHLFLGVTVGGTGTPWHTRGYAPDIYTVYFQCLHPILCMVPPKNQTENSDLFFISKTKTENILHLLVLKFTSITDKTINRAVVLKFFGGQSLNLTAL